MQKPAFTSTGLPDKELPMPFSLVMLLELLLGELGPEPGALLHAESAKEIPIRGGRRGSVRAGFRPGGRGQDEGRGLPAMSSERFLAVLMGPSFRRSSGLLRRSVTFCFSRDLSFRLGSDAGGGGGRGVRPSRWVKRTDPN